MIKSVTINDQVIDTKNLSKNLHDVSVLKAPIPLDVVVESDFPLKVTYKCFKYPPPRFEDCMSRIDMMAQPGISLQLIDDLEEFSLKTRKIFLTIEETKTIDTQYLLVNLTDTQEDNILIAKPDFGSEITVAKIEYEQQAYVERTSQTSRGLTNTGFQEL